jgi:hypothetical protein
VQPASCSALVWRPSSGSAERSSQQYRSDEQVHRTIFLHKTGFSQDCGFSLNDGADRRPTIDHEHLEMP